MFVIIIFVHLLSQENQLQTQNSEIIYRKITIDSLYVLMDGRLCVFTQRLPLDEKIIICVYGSGLGLSLYPVLIDHTH